jgi:hypothetical protein
MEFINDVVPPILESKFEFPKVIDVIINDSYGGYDYSKEALEEIKKNNGACDDRTDQVAIDLIKEWGSKRVSTYISYMNVYKAVENNYSISEYDGLEEIHSYFRRNRYLNEEIIINILKKDSLSSDEKVKLVLQMHNDLNIFKSKVEELCKKVNHYNMLIQCKMKK